MPYRLHLFAFNPMTTKLIGQRARASSGKTPPIHRQLTMPQPPQWTTCESTRDMFQSSSDRSLPLDISRVDFGKIVLSYALERAVAQVREHFNIGSSVVVRHLDGKKLGAIEVTQVLEA
jgi:hypothetical protein